VDAVGSPSALDGWPNTAALIWQRECGYVLVLPTVGAGTAGLVCGSLEVPGFGVAASFNLIF
jgi:hypothetical protein